MRNLFFFVAAILVAVPAAAQQQPAGAPLPEGWRARVDRDASVDQVSFRTMGNGFHATTGPAAVFYTPQQEKSGDYHVAARFVQTRSPEHPEAYGLVIGGDDLDEPDQKYSYFLVRKDGQFFIATRNGAERTVVVAWSPHEAIQKEDASGRQINVLGAQVQGDEVIFTVNDAEVARRPKGEILTEGYWGYRVNHNLDIHIDPIAK